MCIRDRAFPGDAYSHSNPIKAALAVPPEAWAQVLLFCGVMDCVEIKQCVACTRQVASMAWRTTR